MTGTLSTWPGKNWLAIKSITSTRLLLRCETFSVSASSAQVGTIGMTHCSAVDKGSHFSLSECNTSTSQAVRFSAAEGHGWILKGRRLEQGGVVKFNVALCVVQACDNEVVFPVACVGSNYSINPMTCEPCATCPKTATVDAHQAWLSKQAASLALTRHIP